MLHCKAESPLQLHFSLGCLGALAKARSREGDNRRLAVRKCPRAVSAWWLYLLALILMWQQALVNWPGSVCHNWGCLESRVELTNQLAL